MPAGRPPAFDSVEEMEKLIEAYFVECKGKPYLDDEGNQKLDKFGHPIIIGDQPPTIAGLALALGFTSRQSLLNYQGKPEFVDTITRAKLHCHAYTESRLFDSQGARGAQFSLVNNFGWQPEQPQINITLSAGERQAVLSDILSIADNNPIEADYTIIEDKDSQE